MKQTGLFFLIYLIFSTVSFSQDKEIFSTEILDLGDGKIVGSSLAEPGDFVSREFKVEVQKAGMYYISAWINGGTGEKNAKPEYQFIINGNEAEKIEVDKSTSHAVDLKEKQFGFNAGVNTITIKTIKPHCPNVEFVKVSLEKQKRQISGEKFNDYINELSKNTLPENYLEMKNKAIAEELSGKSLKSVELDNPSGNYEHEMDVDFGYTYYSSFYLQAGTTYTFETKGYQADPVMHLFFNYPSSSYSWTSDDDGSGLNSKICITIPVTGYYCILIRKYLYSNPGVCDFYFNNSLYKSNCAVSGTGVICNTSSTGTTNWFTAYLTGDSRIWIEDQTGYPGKIIAENNNCLEESDFYWGLASRVLADLGSVRGVIVSSNSSYYPTGNCDLYMNCKNSNDELIFPKFIHIRICDYFPNLSPEDAIESAPIPIIDTYNCISWSGGITDYEEWPLFETSDYCEKVYHSNGDFSHCDPLPSFDNYYESERYSGAMTYSRTGATPSNSTVDLWALNGIYTHGSVRKPGNNHPHGYDWESKLGPFMRTFHPRHALNGSSYGTVNKYYKIASGLKSTMLLDESIARGLSVIENVELSANEKRLVSEFIENLSLEQKSNLKNKYNAWKETWKRMDIAIHSNPRMYAKSKEYTDFIGYCEIVGEASWPFVFDKIQKGEFLALNVFEDIILPENHDLLDKVKKESNLKSTSNSGAYIVRTPQTYAMKYIKELLKSSGRVTSPENEGIVYSNSFDFKVYPNPANVSSKIVFDLPYDAKVSVEVIDLSGKVLSVPLNNQILTQGDYNCQLNIPESFKGICLVKLRINNNVNVQLLVVE